VFRLTDVVSLLHRHRCASAMRVGILRDSTVLDPGRDQLGERIAVLLEHHHVAVAFNSAITEIKEIRLRAVLIEPLDYGLVEFARMIDVCGSGHH
jgi:hypothetical protein